jgi:quercetin dioxygenase-like cupin family protein
VLPPRRPLALGVATLAVVCGAALAQERPNYDDVRTLLRTGETVIGERLAYPAAGATLIHSLIVTMQAGERTGRHKHGVPTYAYILSGQVTVDYDGGLRRTYRAGEAFMEAMDRWHDGVNDGTEPCRILVVFMGAEGLSGVIRGN